ncbi:hypothetical protein [Arthrobacter sp. H14-L1]|uniref:hypothetical protein n=1 Tax=Arthrobacter sp. H14-L1 TaxID=2996697 RepID=UPI002271049E|nr:hypothetical protein [Arthrobacter sp. H14-L1]MCY0905985.1 hypothetical protein [Arthrobacter sp. H14-L1]
MEEAKTVNADEDARFGPGKRRDELPAELACREARAAAMTGARAPLEEETAAKAHQLAEEKARTRGGDDDEITGAGDKGRRYPPAGAMIEHTVATVAVTPQTCNADAGYCSAANLAHVKTIRPEHPTEFFIPTRHIKHSTPVPESRGARSPGVDSEQRP